MAAVTQVLFTPRLEIVGPEVPPEAVPVGETVAVGLRVRNTRWCAGAAYVVAVETVDGGESEIDGPVVDVPSRATVPVTVPLRLPPGDHHLTFVLYDAWRENVRVDARHGVSLRVGLSLLRVERTNLPESFQIGETVSCTVWGANEGEIDEDVVPIAVLEPVDGGGARERDGRSGLLPAGETTPLPLVFGTDDLAPGRYHAAVRFLTPRGDRVGKGLYRLPVEIRAR